MIEHLFEGLIVAGLAMQITQSSRPASGSEHRFSHLWEMQALGQGMPPVPHGFKVGVGTIAAAALYERVLARDLQNLDIDALCGAWPSRLEVERAVLEAHDSPQLAENAAEESLAKYVDSAQLRHRLLVLREQWPADRLRTLLHAAGCPTRPEEIRVSMSRLRESYVLARTIRRRYTVLDLAHETGILAECLDELFAPDGFWSGGGDPRKAPAHTG